MYSAYEYVVGFMYGPDDEPEPVPHEETDSLDGSIRDAISAEVINPSMVIRKSTTAGFRPSQTFKAIPSMVIKAPEPEDNYDSSVIAVMLTPTGLIFATFGSIITLLAYTTLVGFESDKSIAVAHYGYPVRLLGPLLIICGVVTLLIAAVVYMCTPKQHQIPMVYPNTDDDVEMDGKLRSSSYTRRASTAKVQPASTASASQARKSIIPDSQATVLRSTTALV